jgi:hypothetical protein
MLRIRVSQGYYSTEKYIQFMSDQNNEIQMIYKNLGEYKKGEVLTTVV